MNTTYTYPKRKYKKSDVKFMYVFFDNGDHVSLDGKEIAELSINVYDRLVRHGKGVSPVAESGVIKLKIGSKKFLYEDSSVYNPQEYKKNRKMYIESRCTSEGGITKVWFFDELNWHNVVIGNIQAKMDGEYLTLEFLPQPLMGGAASDTHSVQLAGLDREGIIDIDLDFENCESFYVYHSELSEVNVNFDNELIWGAGDLYRSIKSGYIRIKLEDLLSRHAYSFFNKRFTTKYCEKRLCGMNSNAKHDICHLYVTYRHPGSGNYLQECIEIEDIRPDEELAEIEKRYEKGEYGFASDYVGGHCIKLDDGSIVITFGKNSEKTADKLRLSSI